MTLDMPQIEALLTLLKKQGVAKFKGLDIEVEFDPRVGGTPLPQSLLDAAFGDEDTLDDAVAGERKDVFKRAQKEQQLNLEWSMG